ncbi:amidohydrolase family protein [Caulobacter mirabilis]|uniref:Amidohydrolase n=1 Tax=Caulobacter mirabilis TaxID=69666 RepID=A0A2D2AYU0_9CAUL|nr:amidohydrolase family protein [Caulobacter mirabilis]ATQ43152.1 amidohydrolase [Caulobacter mirabilis]
MKRALFAFAALIAASPAAAETVAIVNARIEIGNGTPTLPSGTVVLKDGRIAAVGAGVSAPAGARVIDAKGGVVTPGLVFPSTNLSASEIGGVRSTRDDNSGSLSAGFDISYSFNPASAMIPLARQTGVTTAVVTPTLGGGGGGHAHDGWEGDGRDDFAGGDTHGLPNLFAGQAATITLADGRDQLLKSKVAVVLDLGEDGARAAGGSRGADLVLIRAALEDARLYARNRAAFARGETRELGLSRIDLEALVPVVEGRTPLLLRVHRASDIRQALRLAREEKLKIILEGAEEGWLVADELAAAGVPVILDSQASLPSQFEALGSRLDNAARLQRAGVQIAIMGSRDFNNLRQARLNAGLAVAYGLPREAAIASVTSVPAKIWGLTSTGSLETGKEADVVLWNGDPLETTSWPVAVFIDGVEQPQSTRAFELRDRYARPNASGYPPAYSH